MPSSEEQEGGYQTNLQSLQEEQTATWVKIMDPEVKINFIPALKYVDRKLKPTFIYS